MLRASRKSTVLLGAGLLLIAAVAAWWYLRPAQLNIKLVLGRGWQSSERSAEAKRAFQQLSDQWKRSTGLRIQVIDSVSWQEQVGAPLEALRRDVQLKINKGKADALVALTAGSAENRPGAALPFDDVLVVVCPFDSVPTCVKNAETTLATVYAAYTKDGIHTERIRALKNFPLAGGLGVWNADKDKQAVEALLRTGKPDGIDSEAKARQLLANTFLMAGLGVQAVEQMRRAIESDPQDANLRIAAANVFASQRNFAEAAAQLRKALEIDPKNTVALIQLGITEALQGKNDQAEASFRKALEQNAASPEAHLGLGRLLAGNPARKQEAQRHFDQALQLLTQANRSREAQLLAERMKLSGFDTSALSQKPALKQD